MEEALSVSCAVTAIESLFRHVKFTFLNKYTGIKIAANLYPVHRFASGIQAKNMVIGLTDVFHSTDFGVPDSSHTVF
jgi:hypothetical protein